MSRAYIVFECVSEGAVAACVRLGDHVARSPTLGQDELAGAHVALASRVAQHVRAALVHAHQIARVELLTLVTLVEAREQLLDGVAEAEASERTRKGHAWRRRRLTDHSVVVGAEIDEQAHHVRLEGGGGGQEVARREQIGVADVSGHEQVEQVADASRRRRRRRRCMMIAAAAAEKVARFDQVTCQLEEQSDIVRQSVY